MCGNVPQSIKHHTEPPFFWKVTCCISRSDVTARPLDSSAEGVSGPLSLDYFVTQAVPKYQEEDEEVEQWWMKYTNPLLKKSPNTTFQIHCVSRFTWIKVQNYYQHLMYQVQIMLNVPVLRVIQNGANLNFMYRTLVY